MGIVDTAPRLDRAPTRHARPEPATAARIGGLDGLRAVAVLAVLAYHLWPGVFTAGFLGVDLFMVLSGFLITRLLVDEQDRAGKVRLGAFWGRRFRRLVPALLAVLTGVAIWVRIAGPEAIKPIVRGQGLASLLYVGNWKLVHDGTSYASLTGPRSPLLHLWSLGIEEQFYALWPLIVAAVLLVAAGRRRTLAIVAAWGAVGSIALMASLYAPHHDPLRLYYGTDTRAFAFMIGAIAAIEGRRRLFRRLGVPALIVMLGAFLWGNSPGVLYRGGFAAFAVVAAVAVVAVSGPSPLGRLLDRAALRLIGRVSYGIYLWHWPVIVLVTADTVPLSGLPLLALRLALIAALTALSWILVEQPYRRLPSDQAVKVAIAGITIAAVSLLTLPGTSKIAYASVDVTKIPKPTIAAPAASVPPTVAAVTLPHTVMTIGDSGMFDLEPALAAGFTSVGAQVVESGYPGEGLTSPPALRASWAQTVQQQRPDLVVVMLGAWDYDYVTANGDAAYFAKIAQTMSVLTADGAHVLWLSVLPGPAVVPGKRVPASQLDRFYSALPKRYPGVVQYLDIDSALTPHPGLLLHKPDGWHLCQDGAAAITQIVMSHFGVPNASWLDGLWRLNPRYNDPVGGCAR